MTHIIKAGDTLWAISQANGMTVDQLQTLNPGVQAHSLEIGQVLNIGGSGSAKSPNNGSKTHIIKAGDTLWAIAQANGMTVDQLQNLNLGVQAHSLGIGTTLNLA